MPDQFLQEWKPKYPLLEKAGDAVDALDTALRSRTPGEGDSPSISSMAADALGLPAMGRILHKGAYGQNGLTKGKNQTFALTEDALDAAGGVALGAQAATLGSRAVGKVAGEVAADVMAGPREMSGGAKAQRGVFAGLQSDTADVFRYAEAVDRHVAGQDMESIRKSTGWFKDPVDKKWKYEIDDSKSKNFLRGAHLEQVMPHKRDTQVAEDAMYLAEIAGKDKNPNAVVTQDHIARFLKEHKGYPHEGALELANKASVGDIKAAMGSSWRKYNLGSVHKLEDVFPHEQLYAAYPELKDYTVQVVHKPLNEVGAQISGDHIMINQLLLDDPKTVRKILIHEIEHAVQNIEGHGRGGNAADIKARAKKAGEVITDQQAMEHYRALPGEAMARNAEDRADMTPEQRREISPIQHKDVGGTLDMPIHKIKPDPWSPKYTLGRRP